MEWGRYIGLGIAPAFAIGALAAGAAALPKDNPVASFYGGGAEGYPAWTESIRWRRVVDMSAYAGGGTAFEKFERARDELAADGGGVLYYPAGTYDFSAGPFDGPGGRGLMLRSGVVIRGEAPEGHPLATDGRLDLKTRFVFGFEPRTNAVDAGPRFSVVLHGSESRADGASPRGAAAAAVVSDAGRLPDWLVTFPVVGGRIAERGKAYRRGIRREPIAVAADVIQTHETVALRMTLEGPGDPAPAPSAFVVHLRRDGAAAEGTFDGMWQGRPVKGRAEGRFFSVVPETPRDWNLIGLALEPGRRLRETDLVGVVWVHLVGGTIWFGPDFEWGRTWATAGSWKGDYATGAWRDRRPDGTHPWDPLAGGRSEFVGAGRGRLVMGCVIQDGCVVNNSISMGRRDCPSGFGPGLFHMARFAPRIGVYGSRVFVANNLLPESRGRNFRYAVSTRPTYAAGPGASGFREPRSSFVLFDYNRTLGIDVNKEMLARARVGEEGRLWQEGVVVRDNRVYNHGHMGFSLSGRWATIAANRNDRTPLVEGWDPEGIGGWVLTLDGHVESSAAGPDDISDNLSRAFEIAGSRLWVHRNVYTGAGSHPGRDGEGLLACLQRGSHAVSWALTANRQDGGAGGTGSLLLRDVDLLGTFLGWNSAAGAIGATGAGGAIHADVAFAGNRAGAGLLVPPGAATRSSSLTLLPPADIDAQAYEGDAVRIRWRDRADNELAYRVDRRITDGPWTPVAYRPPQIQRHPDNPPEWIDFTAPPGIDLRYRVAAIDDDDDDKGAGEEVSIRLRRRR